MNYHGLFFIDREDLREMLASLVNLGLGELKVEPKVGGYIIWSDWQSLLVWKGTGEKGQTIWHLRFGRQPVRGTLLEGGEGVIGWFQGADFCEGADLTNFTAVAAAIKELIRHFGPPRTGLPAGCARSRQTAPFRSSEVEAFLGRAGLILKSE